MATRKVFHTFKHTDGSPWPNYPLKFWRVPGSYTAGETYPEDAITVVTDPAGYFEKFLWCNDEGLIGTTYICQLRDEDFMFTIQPGDPVPLPQLRGLPPGGTGIANEALIGWTTGGLFEMTAVTYSTTYPGVIASATVKWPDGSAGVFTATVINASWELVDAYTVTHTSSGKTVTQLAVTRNSDGSVTAKPALTVA